MSNVNGPPPHAWGMLLLMAGISRILRSTPTRVGNALKIYPVFFHYSSLFCVSTTSSDSPQGTRMSCKPSISTTLRRVMPYMRI